jgi:hypothetical protein
MVPSLTACGADAYNEDNHFLTVSPAMREDRDNREPNGRQRPRPQGPLVCRPADVRKGRVGYLSLSLDRGRGRW